LRGEEIMDSFIESCGGEIRVQGNMVRTARLELDKYEFLDDPAAVVEDLRRYLRLQ
jgi:hypothetical protein